MSLSPRAVVTLTFFAFGAMVGSNLGALPMIVKQASVSPFLFGAVAGTGMLANILMMSVGGYINRHYDHRSMLLMSLPLAFMLVFAGMVVNSVLTFCIATILFNMVLGITDLFMNAEAADVEQDLKRPVFSSFHASVFYGIASFAIISSLISTWLAPWSVCIVTSIPVAIAFGAIYVGLPKRSVSHQEAHAKPVKLPLRLLTFIGLALGFEVACELAAIQWAGQLLTANIPQLAAYSGLGVAFYGFCGGTMRLFGDGLRAKFGDFAVIVTGLLVAIPCLFILSLAPSFLVSVLAFACVGFGFAVLFPCLFSLAARLAPDGKAAAMSYVVLVGGMPRVVLPWVLGWLAQAYSLGAVFAAAAAMGIVALTIILFTFSKAEAAAKM
jgi:MFS family permease